MMTKTHLRYFAPVAAGLLLAACSNDREHWDFGEYFPPIDTRDLGEAWDTPADLRIGEDGRLLYQVALVYDTLLDPRGYDAVERSLPDEPVNAYRDCEEDGRIGFGTRQVSSPSVVLGPGPFETSEVHPIGCAYVDEEQPSLRVTSDNVIRFFETENLDMPADYIGFGIRYPFRVQTIDTSDEAVTILSRVEIHGASARGAHVVEDDNGGGDVTLVEERQRLLYINSLDTSSAESDETERFALRYGTTVNAFVRSQEQGSERFRVTGHLQSVSDLGTDAIACGGGWFHVETDDDDRLLLGDDDPVAGDISAGGLTLSAGRDGDTEEPLTATLSFQDGDVLVTDAVGDSATFSRAEIQAVREVCILKLPVRY